MGPGQKPQRAVFPQQGSYKVLKKILKEIEKGHWRLLTEIVNVSRVLRKPDFCICETKGADQLCDCPAVDQSLCFPYIDTIMTLLPKSKFQASSRLLWPYRPVYINNLVRNPKNRFSCDAAHIIRLISNLVIPNHRLK